MRETIDALLFCAKTKLNWVIYVDVIEWIGVRPLNETKRKHIYKPESIRPPSILTMLFLGFRHKSYSQALELGATVDKRVLESLNCQVRLDQVHHVSYATLGLDRYWKLTLHITLHNKFINPICLERLVYPVDSVDGRCSEAEHNECHCRS